MKSPRPRKPGRIAVKVINHLGDDVMKGVPCVTVSAVEAGFSLIPPPLPPFIARNPRSAPKPHGGRT